MTGKKIVSGTFPRRAARGTVRAMPESTIVSENTGSLHVSFPIELTPCRTLTPTLTLSYNSGSGDSAYGMGYQLSGLMSISRSTKYGAPQYDETDVFVLSSAGELVQVDNANTDSTVIQYRARHESEFLGIEYHVKKGMWLVKERNGINHYLGSSDASQLSRSPGVDIFEWHLDKTIDAHGNEIFYTYTKNTCHEDDLQTPRFLHLQSIQYGILKTPISASGSDIHFAYRCDFDYQKRQDYYLNYRPGFPITEQHLCQSMSLYHDLLADPTTQHITNSDDRLVKQWVLAYDTDHPIPLLSSFQLSGSRFLTDGSQLTQSMPAATFNYQLPRSQVLESDFSTFNDSPMVNLPAGAGTYRWFDLYQDGLPGILYADEHRMLFWRSNGSGQYGSVVEFHDFPNLVNSSHFSQTRIMTIGEAHQPCFVVSTDQAAIAYVINEQTLSLGADAAKVEFEAMILEQFPTAFHDPSAQIMDIAGRGYQDLVVLDTAFPHFYPASKDLSTGYGPAIGIHVPDDFPISSADPYSLVTFTDIFGDGLLHRVQYCPDGLKIWPNLGLTNEGDTLAFGESIQWPLPELPQPFDPRSIFLTDCDGSGATDFLYVSGDTLQVYLNTGKGFSKEPVVVTLPEAFSHQDQLLFGDFFGEANTAIIYIKNDFSENRYYSAIFSVNKPYLMQTMTESSGMESAFEYSTSTATYLQDRQTELPPYRLPFALPVLSQRLQTDNLTNQTLKETYQYHYGDYNHIERRFCGFALVETQRSELIHADTKLLPDRHTQSYYYNRMTSSLLAAKTSPLSNPTVSTGLSPDILKQGYFPTQSSKREELREAEAEAVFALSHHPLAEVILTEHHALVSVSVYNYNVVCLQPQGQHPFSVYTVQRFETVTIDAHQVQDEPKVSRQAVLEYGPQNQVLEELVMHYGRESDLPWKQDWGLSSSSDRVKSLQSSMQQTRCLYLHHSFAANTAGGDFQWLDQASEIITYEITSNVPPRAAKLEGYSPSSADLDAILHHQQVLYWQSNLSDVLPLGQCGATALRHHERQLLGEDQNLATVYTPLLTYLDGSVDQLLRNAGYIQLKDDPTHWWKTSDVRHYSADSFYQPVRITQYADLPIDDQPDLFHQTDLTYDAFDCAITDITEYLMTPSTGPDGETKTSPYTTSLAIDYFVMQPQQHLDHNQVATIMVHDALGRVTASTKVGELNGIQYGNPVSEADIQAVFHDLPDTLDKIEPDDVTPWLKRTFYCTNPSTDPHRPVVHLSQSAYHTMGSLEGETHIQNVISMEVYYADCQGRNIQLLQKTNDADPSQSWVSSGFVRYSDSGRVLSVSLPSFASSNSLVVPDYSTLAPSRLRNQYDAADLLVEQTYLDEQGVPLIKTYDITPWYVTFNDENCNDHAQSYPGVEKIRFTDAGDQGVGYLSDEGQLALSTYDVLGQVLSQQDPRLSTPNLSLTYDLLGNIIQQNSVDRGVEILMVNTQGTLIHRTLGDHCHHYQNDSWQRLVTHTVSTTTKETITAETRSYGETETDAVTKNALGQVFFVETPDGRFTRKSFDISGHCLEELHQVHAETVSVSDPHVLTRLFDAKGRQVYESFPNASGIVYHYDALDQLAQIQPTGIGQLSNASIDLQYQAAGLKSSVEMHAAAVVAKSQYTYSTAIHQRLTGIQHTLSSGNNLSTHVYAYDPVGNLIQTHREYGHEQQSITLSSSVDNRYRLSSFDGLELTGRPIVSDANTIQYQVMTQGQNVLEALTKDQTVYTQHYNYDDGGNLTRIQHDGADSWTLDFTVSDSSNRFKTLVNTKTNEQISSDALYDSAGNLLMLDESSALSWDETNQLKSVTRQLNTGGANSSKSILPLPSDADVPGSSDGAETPIAMTETYGYRGDAFESVKFLTTPANPSAAYSPALFGHHAQTRESFNVKRLKEYGGRLYKVSEFKVGEHQTDRIEQVFLGCYAIKRVYRSINGSTTELILERHTLLLQDAAIKYATIHIYTVDTEQLEASKVVKTNDEPVVEMLFHLTDHLHSSEMDLNADGMVTTFTSYQGFGQLGFLLAMDDQHIRSKDYYYSDNARDSVSGLYYYGARYYAPQFGRWISPDPSGLIDSLNLYAMVDDDPFLLFDFFGFSTGKTEKDIAKKIVDLITGANGITDNLQFAQHPELMSISLGEKVNPALQYIDKNNMESAMTDYLLKNDHKNKSDELNKLKTQWRGFAKGEDEFISTSIIANFVMEYRARTNATQDDQKRAMNFLRLAHALRLPTEMTGHNYNDDKKLSITGSIAQHVTKADGGVYSLKKVDCSTHNDKRVEKIDAILDHGGGLEAVILGAIDYTLSEFVAPPKARNQNIFSKFFGKNADIDNFQDRRDFIKELARPGFNVWQINTWLPAILPRSFFSKPSDSTWVKKNHPIDHVVRGVSEPRA